MDTFYIGNPEAQTADWIHQDRSDDCAVAAQVSIINQFLPHHIGLDEATYVAYQNGWYQPGGGTAPADVGNLFEAYGIDCHQVDHASIEQLAQELQMGHGVVVGVNADELWDQGPMAEFWNWLIDQLGLDKAEFMPANHAVTVIGIDVSDPAHPMVVLNDSGTPDGAGVKYPLDKFMDAWDNSDFFYTATDQAIPHADWTSFDFSKFLGIGTAIGVGATSGNIDLAVSAGALVNEISHQVNWDELMVQI